MNFDFSDDQKSLREELRRMLQRESPPAKAREAIDQGLSHQTDLWRHLVDVGATGLMLPEDAGGAGLGAMELCVAAEELGRQLAAVPYGPTMYLATQALLLGASPAQQALWLTRVAAGEVATLAGLDEEGAGAGPRFESGQLHGQAPLVPDGGSAAWAVVRAQSPEGAACWVVADLAATVTRRLLPTRDPSRPWVALQFNGTAAQALDSVADAAAFAQRLRWRAAVLTAFEALGGADAALEMAAAYARERVAFGRAIGSYQGIKHKLADLYTANQLARVHAWYGAWALACDAADASAAHAPHAALAEAAAAALVSCTRAYTRAAEEALHVHGGMGYTWEADCHLHVRRARQLAVWLGSDLVWTLALGDSLVRRMDAPEPPAVARTTMATPGAADAPEVSMDFEDTPEEAVFRAECRAWLDQNAPLKARSDQTFGAGLDAAARMQAARAWQARKAAAGYGAITWPQAFGGRGGTPMQEVIWRQEEARFDVPTNAFAVSLGMVIPSLFVHATPEVRQAHVGPALHGQHLWCQLLSEPGAGSDLGMLRTRAERLTEERDGRDGWLLHGQKVWTTLGQFADYGMVLARTDPNVPKFEGLTSFWIDMHAPGVTVRPIRQADGGAEFNEVFLDGVFVPDSQRVGAPGQGWKVTMTALMNERLSIGGVMPPELWRTAAGLMQRAALNGRSALDDPRLRERLAELYLQAQGLWLLQCRGLTALGRGKEPGPELSVAKIVGARTLLDFARLAIDLQGPRGVLTAEELGEGWELVDRLWFGASGMRIAGGTDEIVKNSVGERVLGLPPEPRTDKGVPFSQLVR
ncbi:MAG: acyl-CoA dehydrogenase [Betaproteobacteria bacterium]|jgi:alkylation response protein AidB-like acyl-CoA dehydrogenase